MPNLNLTHARNVTDRLPIEALHFSEDELTRHLRSARAKRVFQASRHTELTPDIDDAASTNSDDDTLSQSSLISGRVKIKIH